MIKEFIRNALQFLHLDLSKNLEYDRLTKIIMNRVVKDGMNTIDVGCHKGEILEVLLRLSPSGQHIAFEPLPDFYNNLVRIFGAKASINPFALSDKVGVSSLQYVKNAPAYSGLKQRKYDTENPGIETIDVEVKTLDELIGLEKVIHFMKIDLEGAELGVLKGGKELLKKHKPVVVFECGLGASDYYGTNASEVYTLLKKEIGLEINTLKSYVKRGKPLTETEFEECFNTNREYYFVAYP